MPKPFNSGDKIEVRHDTNGLSTWKIATVLRHLSATNILVQYQTLTQSASDQTEDTVPLADVRPAPPPELHRYFLVGEQVEAYCTQINAWRKTTILDILENSLYAVSFQDHDVVEVEHWMLRAVRHWCDGAWDPPFPLQEKLPATEIKSSGLKLKIKFGGKSSKENFGKGMSVEIKGEEDGFRGSWYAAVVVDKLENDKLLVEYRTLTTEDKTELVKEEVTVSSVRPPPPFIAHTEPFGYFDQVDAWYNDGWWEGYVTKLISGSRYMVKFTHSGGEMVLEHCKLRPHQEWNDGKWSVASKVNLTDGTLKPSHVKQKRKYNRKSSMPKFGDGMMVEVKSDEEGYQGAWFCAVIVGSFGDDSFLVEYQNLKTNDESALLREKTCASKLRPFPPKLVRVDRYKPLDEVDAWYNDAWWVGHVSSVLDGLRYAVYFWATNEELIFEHFSLRPHQEWIGGKWTVSQRKRPKLAKAKLEMIEEQNCGTRVRTEKQNYGLGVRPEFVNGMEVEVKSDQEGYVGSWYQATIVKPLGTEMYLIEYQTLVTDDGTELLKEEACSSCIRPCPPIVLKEDEYKYCEEVDAWYNDGWWVGRVSEILGGCKYLVFFNSTHEVMKFNRSDLRPHQDWINGQWFMAKV